MAKTAEQQARFDEWAENTALGYIERMMNAWISKGLPAGVLSRAMIGSGVSAIQAMEGYEEAFVSVEAVSAALAENAPPPPVRN